MRNCENKINGDNFLNMRACTYTSINPILSWIINFKKLNDEWDVEIEICIFNDYKCTNIKEWVHVSRINRHMLAFACFQQIYVTKWSLKRSQWTLIILSRA